MLGIMLVSCSWMISNVIWILLYFAERGRRQRADEVAKHFFTLCRAMNDGTTVFVDFGEKPELRQ